MRGCAAERFTYRDGRDRRKHKQKHDFNLAEGVICATSPTRCALKVMVRRRMNETDRGLRILTRKRVGHALKRLERKGVTESRRMGKSALLSWRISKPDAQLEGGWRNGSEAQIAALAHIKKP